MVNITLDGAPLVIKKRKVINVRIRGEFAGDLDDRLIGKKDSLTVDVKNQTEADIKYLLRHITIAETEQQIKLKNPPTRVAVDNREGKQLALVERKTEVTYGNFLDRAMLKFVERSLFSAIHTLAVNAEGKALGSKAYWEWRYVANPRKNKYSRKLPKNLRSIRVGSYLILKPRSNMVGLANMFAARKDAGWPEDRWLGPGSSGGRGFMSRSIDMVKRSNLLKNYTIHVVFTKRFRVKGEVYRKNNPAGPLTPVIIIRAKRNRRYARIK